MRFDTIFVLAILAFLTSFIAEDNATFGGSNRRRVRISAMGVRTLEPIFTQGR
jgi:hypothetical protein